mmetsp:Transcript_25573/g.43693  ORF Transcript_25573/g.43693 Transcript_25573/m.43693 type:complete len:156 (+) Transcript_25573:704-1171(+)
MDDGRPARVQVGHALSALDRMDDGALPRERIGSLVEGVDGGVRFEHVLKRALHQLGYEHDSVIGGGGIAHQHAYVRVTQLREERLLGFEVLEYDRVVQLRLSDDLARDSCASPLSAVDVAELAAADLSLERHVFAGHLKPARGSGDGRGLTSGGE